MSWWTKIVGEPADWRLCKQLDTKYVISYKDAFGHDVPEKSKSGCVLTYFLYEDQDGNRKFDLLDSEEGDINVKTIKKDNYAYRCALYRNTIRPWLDGRYNADIPSYEQVPVDDFKSVLKGK